MTAQSDDGLMLTYRTYNFSPDLAQWIAQSKNLPAGSSKLSFSFDKTTHHDHSEDERWGGGASLSLGFFSFGANADHGRQTVDVQDAHFAMSFSARNVQTFTVTPGQWFNGEAVKAFQNGPWIPGGPVAQGIIKLWGAQGIFNLMPAQFVVAYKPKVVVSVSQSDYQKIHESFNVGGGFSIGPFGFGASYHKDTNDVKWDNATNTITGTIRAMFRRSSLSYQVCSPISNNEKSGSEKCHP